MELTNFRKKLAFALINNNYFGEDKDKNSRKKRKIRGDHALLKAPKFCGKFSGGLWKKNCKQPYQNYPCKTRKCKNRVRTMCSCSMGNWMCGSCHTTHVIETMEEENI